MDCFPAASASRPLWLILGISSCLILFFVLATSHPVQPVGTFRYEIAMAAAWPATWIFSLPGVVPPTFFDLQDILWACEVTALGRDVYTEPPWGWDAPYVYGYPKGWLLFSHFGLNRTHTRTMGLSCVGLFLVSVVLAVRPNTMPRMLWLVAGILAPPAIECIAQANNDVVLFAMLVTSALLWKTRFMGGAPAVGMLVIAGVLKLHPAAALVSLLDGSRRTLLLVVGGVLSAAAYFGLRAPDLEFMSRNTPRPHVHAVGHLVLPSRLFDGATRHPAILDAFNRAGGIGLWQDVLPLLFSIAFGAVVAGCMWRGLRTCLTAPQPGKPAELEAVLFRLGACIHITSFAIGHNWLHREVFLLMTGPWLLASRTRWWLAGLIVAMWWLGGIERGVSFVTVQLVTWVVTGGLTYYLAANLADPLARSLPPWASRFLAVSATRSSGNPAGTATAAGRSPNEDHKSPEQRGADRIG